MIFGFLLILFILVCILLCFLVLIQSDKGGGISGAIGGLSGVNNFLGSQDAGNVLTKGTYIFGSVFLLLCILMTFFAPGAGLEKSGQQRRAEKAQAITSTPQSVGSGMEFSDDDAGSTPAAAGGAPNIVGGIIQGGVEMEMGADGTLRPVQNQSEGAGE